MKHALHLSIILLSLAAAVSCSRHGEPSPELRAIERLNRESFDLRYKDIELSRSRSFEALRLIEEKMPDHYDARAYAWNNLAYSHFLTCYFDSTKLYIEKIRSIGPDYFNRDIEEAITYITEARLYLRECRYAEAFIIYDSTLTLFSGGLNALKYNDVVPFKKYDHDRYNWAKSDYLIGNAVLAYYYRDTELPVILRSLDKIEANERLHVDTTQLSVLYYTYAGAYEKEVARDPVNFFKTLEYIEKGLDLMEDPRARNDYYLANFYQLAGQLMTNRGTRRWMEGEDSAAMRRAWDGFKTDYLAGKYGWDREVVGSRALPLTLLKKADEMFRTYDDPYQNLASELHVGRFYLELGDTATALDYFRRSMVCDSIIEARGAYARIWTKNLYGTMLQHMAGEFPVSEIQRWFDIYSRESEIIAENTRRDYDTQKGKAEAEAVAKKTMVWVFLILTVCVAVIILLYFLDRQNRKLRKARSELRARNEQLDEQYKQLGFVQKKLIEQKRMELLTYVVRGISHELSQPLGSITQTLYDTVGDVEKLSDMKSLDRQQFENIVNNISSDLQTISRSKDAISELVNSFRNTIKENITDPEQEFNLADKLEDIVKVLRPSIKSNIDLRVECDGRLVIRSFPLFFSQVVTNLVSNANQHAFPNSDRTTDSILISCSRSGSDLIVKCIDNGVGIPEEEMDRLCQPFVSKKRANLGLGLSLVKNIVEQYMNGEIDFTSDKGLTVTVTIPDCIISPVNE